MSTELVYRPSPWGARYHRLPYDFVLGGGAAGVGKTWILVADPIEQILSEHARMENPDHEYPIERGKSTGWALHLRRTYTELKYNMKVAAQLFPALDPEAKPVDGGMMWIFSSGYRFEFGNCEHPGDWSKYYGQEYTHIAFDELITFEEEQFDQISTRKRSSDPVLMNMLKVRAMSNPAIQRKDSTFTVKNPTWVRDRFVARNPDGNKLYRKTFKLKSGATKTHTEMFVPGTLYDNPNQEFVDEYEKTLLNAPWHIQQAQLYGNWFVTPGSYYGGVWNPQLHICHPFRIPEDWPVFRAMDWGFKQFGCVLWMAMDPDGNLFVFYEYTFRGKTDRQVAQAIRRIENDILKIPWRDGKSQLIGPADTQIWERRGQSVAPMAEVFSSMGIDWTKAAKESRIRWAQEIYRRLADHRSGTVTPGLVIFSTCTRLIKTLPTIQCEENDPEMPRKDNDSHWYETLGYGAAFASRGPRGIPSRVSDEDYVRRRRRETLSTGLPY